ncbi:MAG: hypothetical protein INR72_15035, partial [Williamsia herbipolensis]|nr:hypothetical protein [Williamsia herbipolensis]
MAPAPADHVGQTVAPVMAPAAVMAPTSVMPGAAVDTHANGTYHGGALTQRDVVRADGTTVREVTYADGSGNTREISTGADGFDTQTWHEPDGTEVTYHSGLDGVMRIAVAPDDSSSILTWGGDTPDQAHLVDTHYAADGGAVTSTTTWTGAQDRAPGGTVFTIETPQPDGTTMRTDVTATVHGGAFASTSAGDEAQTVTTTRLAVEDVHNADGTTTRVFSGFPDGHTDAFTFDHYGRAIFHEVDAGPARPVLFGNTLDNEGYHGGLIAHHDTATMIDGTKTTQLTYADGTSVDALITVSAGPDGSEHWTETHTESDGTEISIDRGPDGAFRDAHPIDGTRTTQFTSGTMLDEVAYDAGGNPTATTHWDASPHATGGTLFTVTTPAGDAHRDVETTVNALPGGGAVASTSTYVGDALTTTYTRLDVDETPNDDGTTTYFYRGFPDGRTEAFTVDASGNAVFHQTTPGEPGRPLFVNPYVNQGFHGGLVESREHVVGEPGSRQVTSVDYVYGDGHTETGEVTEHADGSRTVTILGDDGSEKTLDDGTRNVVDLQGVRNSQSYAGTHLEDTTWATDGTTVTNETTWDGPMDPPSGSLMYQTWQNNADGTSAYSGVVATPDGGAAYYGLSADGSGAISVRLSVDTIENPDGSVTKVYDGFPDGHTDSFTFSVTGSPIYHESAPGTPPDVPHGSPLFNEGYRGGLIGQQDIDTAPDGSTTLQLTYADGTVLEGHRTVDADGWPTTVTTAPDGTLVSDYSAGDHGTVTTVGADGSSYQTWSGSGLDDVRFGVDGAHLATTHWDAPNSGLAPGQPMFDITEPRADGTTLTTKVVATDGGAEAYVSDGTVGGLRTTVRLEVTVVPNVDGTLTQIYSGYPDGHTDAFTFDVDGHPVYHQSDPAPDEPETGSLAVGETPRTETAHGAEPTAATSTAAPTTSTPAAQA